LTAEHAKAEDDNQLKFWCAGQREEAKTLRVAAASYALAGRLEEARKAVARALELDPDMRLANLKDRIGIFRRSEDYAKYAHALRKAGLPE
jgi:tetratricopeptide (TPR) repeat protein